MSNESASSPYKGKALPKWSWPHAPNHYKVNEGCYIITCGTYQKVHHFHGDRRLRMLQRALLTIALKHAWNLQAWAVFPNHYHCIAHSAQATASRLDEFLCELHSRTAIAVNRTDGTEGRQVWHSYWDSSITFEKSHFARLNYVHQNAVKHGIVQVANQYPYCSAAWFERHATLAQVRLVYGFKTDKLAIADDF